MMEFTLKVRIDSQDEKYAYNVMRQSLQFCGLDIVIQDGWLKNNRPLPDDVADITAANWLSTHEPLSIDQRIRHTGKWHDEYAKFVAAIGKLPSYEDLMKERKQ